MKYITLLAIPTMASSLSASIILDTFDNGSFNVTQTGPGTNTSGAITAPGIIGGSRLASITVTEGAGVNNINNSTTPGQLQWNQDVDTSGTFALQYGSDGGFAAMDANLELGGENAISLGVIGSDQGAFTVMSLTMDDGSVWSNTQAVANAVGGPLPGDPDSPFALIFRFSEFTTGGAGVFDASNVDGITFSSAAPTNSRNWAIDSLDAVVVPVPEPSSTALLGLGGLALILRRRR